MTTNSASTIDPPVADAGFAGDHVRAARKATEADQPALAQALARAFYNDPAVCHCLPNDGRRMGKLDRGFDLFLRRIYMPHDECYTVEGTAGGALWAPPGEWKLSALAQLALLPAMARTYGSELTRVLRVLGYMEKHHPEEPHYYLAFLGVEPAHQGRGIGSKLMHPVLSRCDRESIPAYLEASTPRSRALYERHGFELIEEMKLPGNGPPSWRMWREPAVAAGGSS
ncbi:MAG: GNAT family N-acetyltransferase [Actinobacteria bacterium]|nr:GNAT family N-acetyltransferase [Actinomycetota bacterium]